MTHQVEKGDNLFRISLKYNTTILKLKSWNNLKSEDISAGQLLIVSAPEKPVTQNTDTTTLREAQDIFTVNVALLIAFIHSRGFTLSFGRAYDIPEVQPILVAKGLSNALSGKHQERLAIDLNLFLKDYYLFSDKSRKDRDMFLIEPVAEYWSGLNPKNRFGGYFKTIFDPYHFESSM